MNSRFNVRRLPETIVETIKEVKRERIARDIEQEDLRTAGEKLRNAFCIIVAECAVGEIEFAYLPIAREDSKENVEMF